MKYMAMVDFDGPETKKRILFFKNEPEKLLKTNDRQKKRTGKMAKRT
jgi:hypothetical protein